METRKMNLTEKDNHSEKITALYCRVALRESEGIRQQKILLEQYAREQGFRNIQFYIDDGYSGLNFTTRPALNRLLEDIEARLIGTVIVKDLSRLGRDYSRVKKIINRDFPQAEIRFISILNHNKKLDTTELEIEKQITEFSNIVSVLLGNRKKIK